MTAMQEPRRVTVTITVAENEPVRIKPKVTVTESAPVRIKPKVTIAEPEPEPETSPAETPWLNRQEAADYLRVHPRTLDRWAAKGVVTQYRISGIRSVRYKAAELDSLVTPQGL